MILCKDCQFYHEDEHGRRIFACDPFNNIVEPECIQKWQLLKIEMLLSTYQGMSSMQQKMAPMQDKIFKYIKRELDDIDETDSWKYDEDDDNDDNVDNEDDKF